MSSHTQRVRSSQMDWPGWYARMAGDHPRRPEYLGLAAAEASKQVRSQRLRVIDTDQIEPSGGRVFLTADLRADRVNLLIQDGVVTSAARL